MTLVDAFDDAAGLFGSKAAYISGKNRVSYKQLETDSRRLANGLSEYGIRNSERVAIQLSSPEQFVTACLAVWRTGASVVPVDPVVPAAELGHYLNITRAGFIINRERDPGLPDEVIQLQPSSLIKYSDSRPLSPPTKVDEALVLFSSGTTGEPKGIIHTHASLLTAAKRSNTATSMSSDDVLLATSLLSTGFGLHAYFIEPLLCGASVVIVHPFHPRVALDVARREQVTRIQTVPAVLKLLLAVDNPASLPALRVLIIGAAALNNAAIELCVQKLGVRPTRSYGMSEVGRIASADAQPDTERSSEMSVHAGVDLRIFASDYSEIAAGEVGEIGLRSTSLCHEFYLTGVDEQTALPMPCDYFMTGDLGVLSSEGKLILAGRKKSFIMTPRFKVDPTEVEQAITRHPDIADAAVLPVADKSGYDIIKAYVVAVRPMSESEVMAFCSDHLVAGKCPQLVAFVDRIPRNTLGKIEMSKLTEHRCTD